MARCIWAGTRTASYEQSNASRCDFSRVNRYRKPANPSLLPRLKRKCLGSENSAAVQFNHRVLGLTTFASANLLWLASRRLNLPGPTRLAVSCLAGMSWIQATLGISTLLYLVPVPLAASHQAGSLTLLTFSTWLLHTITRRKPVFRP